MTTSLLLRGQTRSLHVAQLMQEEVVQKWHTHDKLPEIIWVSQEEEHRANLQKGLSETTLAIKVTCSCLNDNIALLCLYN